MEKMVLLFQALTRNIPRSPSREGRMAADRYEESLGWSADIDARWYYERRSFPG